jgi:hypothetical protein
MGNHLEVVEMLNIFYFFIYGVYNIAAVVSDVGR